MPEVEGVTPTISLLTCARPSIKKQKDIRLAKKKNEQKEKGVKRTYNHKGCKVGTFATFLKAQCYNDGEG